MSADLRSRPFFFFPAAVIGIGLAILFFKIYGRATRPDVPVPVAKTLSYYAPGVTLGQPVNGIKGLGELTWVRHLGFVSNARRGGFVQTRLLLTPEEANKDAGNPAAIVQAVELVSTGYMMGEITGNTPNMSIPVEPRYGCAYPTVAGIENRLVRYWTTRNDLGGYALLSGFSKIDTLADQAERREEAEKAKEKGYHRTNYGTSESHRYSVWSVLIWNGPFEGSKTLRANFGPVECQHASGTADPPPDYAKTIAASDSLLLAFDVVAAKQREAAATAKTRAAMDSVGRFADACFGTNLVHTDGWSRRDLGALPISVLMPAEYTRRPRAAGDAADSLAQTFAAPDGSAIWFGRRSDRFDLAAVPDLGKETECEATIATVPAHLETGRRLPAMVTKTTTAAYELSTGGWLVVIASAPTAERQQQQLRMIREVQFGRMWNKPATNPPRLAIDSL